MRSFTALLLPLALIGCSKAQHPSAVPPSATPKGALGASAPSPAMTPPATPPAPQGNNIKGTIVERMDAPPYTYLKLKTAQNEVWAAVPETKAGKGTEVTVFNAMQMNNFESKTLKRTFEVVFFGTLTPPAAAGAPADGTAPGNVAMTHAMAAKGPMDAPDVKVEKATGPDARTVAETHAQKAGLKEKTVTIHGKVVKFTGEVMGKNWIHLRDGSGDPAKGDNDIAVTTHDSAKLGDVVLIKGTVRTNKDFGSGYTYDVIVEDATIKH